jgi:predicted flavoprotein YhiN
LVIGGGAAGMTAAISARRLGAAVTILEKNPRVGKKNTSHRERAVQLYQH